MPCPRLWITCWLCLVLLIARVAGLHAHDSHGAPIDGAAAAVMVGGQFASDPHHHHGDSPAQLMSERTAHHFADHLGAGATDLNLPDKTPGKLPALPLSAALLGACMVLLLLFPPALSFRRLLPPPRLRHRRWTYFAPPSHAPPIAS